VGSERRGDGAEPGIDFVQTEEGIVMALLIPAIALFVLAVVFVAALGRAAAAGDRTRQEAYRRWRAERGRERPTHPHAMVPVRRQRHAPGLSR